MRRALSVLILALALTACADEGVREEARQTQFERLQTATTELVCASGRDQKAEALHHFVDELNDADLLKAEGRVHEDLVADMISAADCEG